jgi:hypothetical protein
MDLSAALHAWSAAFAAHGFAGATLARTAAGSGLEVDQLATAVAGRWEAVHQLTLAMDRAALASATPDPLSSTRDRLFEMAMARYDAMRKHRPALRRLLVCARTHPGLALCLALQLGRSASTLLDAANAPTTGLAGIARIKALAAILADVGRVWEADEDPDLGATMAALDRRLGQVERCATRLCGRGLPPEHSTEPAGADLPDIPEPNAVPPTQNGADDTPTHAVPERGRRRRG